MQKHKTGYVYEELYMWHDAGSISFNKWVEPGEIWENPATKRRIHGLLCTSGLIDFLTPIRARHATKEDILRFHTIEYHDRIMKESKDNGGDGGEQCRFAHGAYEIATLAIGGAFNALDAILSGEVQNAYCLIRPPGHHAVRDKGMGFCIFNNIALTAMYAKTLNKGIHKISIVDYDVHWGNGTQQAFWNDSTVQFISIHQDNNYPQGGGYIHEIGGPDALGSTINVPLPPGSGSGAYYEAFNRIVIPALYKFQPDIILVSSGFDANYMDPLGAMMLSAEAFGHLTELLMSAAHELCHDKLLFFHEGGYSKDYVPFCGLSVISKLSGVELSHVKDPYHKEVTNWGYQSLQQHQKAVIDQVVHLHGLLRLNTDENGKNNTKEIQVESHETNQNGNVYGHDTISTIQSKLVEKDILDVFFKKYNLQDTRIQDDILRSLLKQSTVP